MLSHNVWDVSRAFFSPTHVRARLKVGGLSPDSSNGKKKKKRRRTNVSNLGYNNDYRIWLQSFSNKRKKKKKTSHPDDVSHTPYIRYLQHFSLFNKNKELQYIYLKGDACAVCPASLNCQIGPTVFLPILSSRVKLLVWKRVGPRVCGLNCDWAERILSFASSVGPRRVIQLLGSSYAFLSHRTPWK